LNWDGALCQIFLLWCAVVAIRFIRIVVREIATPFNGGADWSWVLGWLLISGFILSGAALLPKKISRSLWLLPLLGLLIILVLSGAWLAALRALWLLSLSAALGATVLHKLAGRECSTLEYLVCGTALGTGTISLTILLLGLLNQLSAVTIWVLCLILSFFVLWLYRRRIPIFASRQYSETETAVVCSVLASIVLAYSLWAIAPEISYDALNYHLAVPAKYLQSARIVDVPFFHAYFARWIELFFTACLAVGGPATAKFWVFLIGLCTTAAVYELGRSAFNDRVGLWAAALFLTTPLVGWLFSTADVENVLALFVTSSFIALVRWEDSGESGWLYAAAALAGIAAGSKVNALLPYVVIAPIVVVQVLMTRPTDLRRTLHILTTTGLAAGIFAVPTYVLTYSFTGNPIFPLLNGIFKSPRWTFSNAIMNTSDYGLPTTASWLIRFPFRLTFDTIHFGEAIPRGSIGVSLLFAFPFGLFLMPRVRPAVRILLIAAATYVIALFYTMQYARYYILIFPIVTVIGTATILALTSKWLSRWWPAALLVLVVVQPFVYSQQFWNIPERIPVALALGLEDRESFLRRALPGYAAAMYLNEATNSSAKILGVGTENLRYYLRAELQTQALALSNDPLEAFAHIPSVDALAASIKRLGFTHLLVTRSAAKNPLPEHPYLRNEFLQTYAR
jgi:4-amino-4-deoxy-L-arabinose transferase-like glycosyltransferase